jgi:hypothetical protein
MRSRLVALGSQPSAPGSVAMIQSEEASERICNNLGNYIGSSSMTFGH